MPPSKRQVEVPAAAAAGTAAAAAAGVGLKRLLVGDGRERSDSSAYRLLAGEPVGDGIRRVVVGRVDDAVAQLRGGTETDGGPGDADWAARAAEGVHEARKDIKKIRSALRLVRAGLGDEVWRRENDHYREIGRGLSGFRDAEVMVETMDALAERFGETPGERLAEFRAELEGELHRQRDGALEPAMVAAAKTLEEGRARVESLPLNGDGWELIGPGLTRSYRRGRKRLRNVENSASVANLHEWRKRVKDLWYQLRLLQEADPDLIGTMARHAHDLSDHLGDDHDLALLREEARRRPEAFGEPADQRYLDELIDLRRGELQFASISLGQRIYDRKPKKFSKRIEARWRAWDPEPVDS